MPIARSLVMAAAVLSIAQPIVTSPATAQPVRSHPHHRAKHKSPPLSVERSRKGEPILVHEGTASFYGHRFHGRRTASGMPFDQNKPTAASRVLPLGARATVINEANGKTVEVTVTDRGPYVGDRVIDLSRGAAKSLDMLDDGLAPVRIEVRPSAQPNEAVKDEVEAKVERLAPIQTAERPTGDESDALE